MIVSLERSDSRAKIFVVAIGRVLHLSGRDRTVVVPIPALKLFSNFASGYHIVPVGVKTSEQFSNNSLTIEVVSRHNFHFVALALLASVVRTPFKVFCMRQKPIRLV